MMIKRKLLAFVHMERAAGTTLNYILRRNFLLRHVDVRPLSAKSNRTFRPRDLARTLRINPALICISGHSVVPWSGLETVAPNIEYITMLRDPVARYVSHYMYWIEKKKMEIDFEKFLDIEQLHNLQTKRIAGSADIDKAKECLKNKFLAVGVLHKYDEFLMILSKKLRLTGFDSRYIRRNASKAAGTKNRLAETYQDQITRRNELDIALYDWVCEHILPAQEQMYGPDLEEDLKKFVAARTETHPCMAKSYIDYVGRKIYFNPAIGLRRILGGLPYHGTY